jgi:hypothetical protein
VLSGEYYGETMIELIAHMQYRDRSRHGARYSGFKIETVSSTRCRQGNFGPELATNLANRLAIVLAEIRNGLEVRARTFTPMSRYNISSCRHAANPWRRS